MHLRSALVVFLLAAATFSACKRSPRLESIPEVVAGLGFTNHVVSDKPWSIHVARVARNGEFTIHSVHAMNGALGLTPLTEQVRAIQPELGSPLVAVNGDFYQRERAYAGDARGLQIINGELISAPAGTAAFWVDRADTPRTANVASRFTMSSNGKTIPIGLNEELFATNAVLFTPAAGASTRTTAATELVLEQHGTNRWLPLTVGDVFQGKIREVRRQGNTSLTNGIAVLALGATVLGSFRDVAPGQVITISTATEPPIQGAKTAIGGGPVLLRDGRKLKIDANGLFDPKSYSARSMLEEHPRSAIGWNDRYYFFVQVDGRSKTSVGMTLDQLRDYMHGLGCKDAMNLDGGGSATLWCNGAVVNKPCDGFERPVANGLVALRKAPAR
jgi:hypothetical protein